MLSYKAKNKKSNEKILTQVKLTAKILTNAMIGMIRMTRLYKFVKLTIHRERKASILVQKLTSCI